MRKGDCDEIVPYLSGRRLFETAPEPEAFETIEAVGHDHTVQLGGAEYFDRIRTFLDQVVPDGRKT